jgi:hypothetical protein
MGDLNVQFGTLDGGNATSLQAKARPAFLAGLTLEILARALSPWKTTLDRRSTTKAQAYVPGTSTRESILPHTTSTAFGVSSMFQALNVHVPE